MDSIPSLAIVIIPLLILLYLLISNTGKLPLSLRHGKSPYPVDVVFTWAGEGNPDSDPRVADNNELKYSLRSVRKYMPWVNHIYILMNPPAKKPSWFNDDYKDGMVTIVDHRSTFINKKHLPTTRSEAIEWSMVNIPNLSERFIYFNDDVFVARDLSYSDFFDNKGRPIFAHVAEDTVELDSSKIGFEVPPRIIRGFYLHIPIPLTKSSINSFRQEFPDYVDWIQSKQKRSGIGCGDCRDIGVCPCTQIQGSIAPYMLSKKMASTSKSKHKNSCGINYINSSCMDQLDKLLLTKEKPTTFCINDTSTSTDQRIEVRKKMQLFFDKMYPSVPPHE